MVVLSANETLFLVIARGHAKVKIDSEILKKYVPDALSMEKFIYSYYITMANIKKLTEENQKNARSIR